MVHVISLWHSLVCQTPTKLIVYYHALELAFSCLQQCTLTYWGMFSLFITFQFLSAKCRCSVSIHTLIDVASIMFAEECCYVFFLFCFCLLNILGWCCVYKVLGRSWWSSRWSVGLIVLFAHLFICYRLLLSGTSLIFPIIISWFPIFSTRKDSVNVLCWGKRLPLDHLTMLCCHVAYLGKVIFCGSLWCCEFSSQVAFISLCRRKRRFKKKVLCFIFSLFHHVYFLYPKWWWLRHTFHFGHHY